MSEAKIRAAAGRVTFEVSIEEAAGIATALLFPHAPGTRSDALGRAIGVELDAYAAELAAEPTLEQMWHVLRTVQPLADQWGFGDTWARMLEDQDLSSSVLAHLTTKGLYLNRRGAAARLCAWNVRRLLTPGLDALGGEDRLRTIASVIQWAAYAASKAV